jgi:preprotein translocase subunit SecG
MMQALMYLLVGLLVLTSAALILLVLLHRGKGGGLSSMFGGGVSSNLSGSSVAEKNLDRITVIVAVIWVIAIVGFGIMLRQLTAN